MHLNQEVEFYWNVGSPTCRAVKALLLIGQVPFKEHNIDIIKAENKSESFRAINPDCQVPFIREEGFSLG